MFVQLTFCVYFSHNQKCEPTAQQQNSIVNTTSHPGGVLNFEKIFRRYSLLRLFITTSLWTYLLAGGADESMSRTIELLGESNYCYFPEGTYEMHTSTTAHQTDDMSKPRAEWMLNVLWNMKGIFRKAFIVFELNYACFVFRLSFPRFRFAC